MIKNHMKDEMKDLIRSLDVLAISQACAGVPLSSAQTDAIVLYKGGQPQAILSPAWGAGALGTL